MTTPPYGQDPQHGHAQPLPHPAPPYPAPPYPAPPYPAPMQACPRPPAPVVIGRHQAARPAMVVGILTLVGIPWAGMSLFLAPFAWALGATARREILASGGALAGLDAARAGIVMGIIGCVLLVVLPFALVLLAVLGQIALGTA